jgi:hypothetical protein
MTVLRGPADPDHYRVKVGRYGDRWYTDPLPTCPIAEATDWQGPSWSIVKGAAGKDWSYVTNKRNGHSSQTELLRIAGLEPDERTAAFNLINKRGLEQAGGRGTIVHWWAEDLLAGRTPREVTEPMLFTAKLPKAALVEAYEYLPALHAFFDHYQPEVIAAEYVAIHRTLNGVGYGCTPDVAACIGGTIYGIDWKTRGADSDHGAYPEEAAQIAAGACAEYIICTGLNGHPTRDLVPPIEAGLVVSIKPDGCRIYPTDIDKGFNHVEAMHAFWVARRVEKDAIGKPWPPTPINEETPCLSKTALTSSTASSTSSPETSTASTTPYNTSSTAVKHSASPSSNSKPDDDLAFTSTVLATAMLTWSPELRQYLKDWWPTDTPTPGAIRRGEATWTEPQLDQIQQLCDLGDAPFWQPAEQVGRTR